MNLAEYSIRNRTISWMVILLLIAGGILAFQNLGRLEDPNFTIKQAMVITAYPGASAQEVEEEITLPIENAIQQLPYVDNIDSTSSHGLSQIEVEMKSIYRKQHLAQIWDEMRRKINDLQSQLPPGAHPPTVYDDFGDVYGLFIALSGQGYSYQELDDYAEFLRRELVVLPGVGKVNVGGRLQRQIIVEIDRSKLNASGFSAHTLKQILDNQNLVSDGGSVLVGSERIRVSTEDSSDDQLARLGGILLGQYQGELIYLRDVADIKLDYEDPPKHLYRFNNQAALTVGVSFASGVNVVEVGEHIRQRLAELEAERPVGLSVHSVYDQPGLVAKSVDDFLLSLAQAIAIVVVVLLFTMGFRPGLLMSGVLGLTILGTFIVMDIYAIELHRISLGALIIALGMLVDNALVVTEGIMVGQQRGKKLLDAARTIVSHNSFPLLGATLIAITAFAPIGLSSDASGEFTGALFWVLLISLFISWLLAISITPFLCHLMLKPPKRGDADTEAQDPYRGIAYRSYRRILQFCLRFRWLTVVLMLTCLVAAVTGMKQVKQGFFPNSSLPMFLVNYWLPEGTDIHATERRLTQLGEQVLALEAVQQVTTTVGQGAERFMLTYARERSYSSYGQLLVQTQSFDSVAPTLQQVQQMVKERHPDAFVKFERFALGPATGAKIEARLIGPDPEVLRALGQQVEALFLANDNAINIRQDWRNQTKVIRPQFVEAEGRRLGISKADVDRAFALNLEGQRVGIYRNGSDLMPIIMRPPLSEREDVAQLENIQIYSTTSRSYVAIGQVIDGIEVQWEDPLIKRRDRKRTLTVQADPADKPKVTAMSLWSELAPQVEALELPPGYSLKWGGEYESQQKANKAVFASVPLGILVMFVITVFMFKSMKQTLTIWLTVPLAIIGVTVGLLSMDQPFSFMALLAVFSLVGMQIKNGIVLLEEIKRLQEEEQKAPYEAIVQAGVSRLRPVSMAALTTILGMIPLLGDVFFAPMAVTIMFGLGFATVLTLVVVPVLFALFYRTSGPSPQHA